MTGHEQRSPEQPRLSREDRAGAVERLDVALREDRLDLVEYDERMRAVESATTPQALAAQLADLPDRPGVREWRAGLRVRARDRHQATVWLADALTEGTLGADEHERRLAAAGAAVRYEQLREALDGVPGPSDAERERLLVTAADRRALAARLDRALAEGQLGVDDHAEFESRLTGAYRYRTFDEVSTTLDEIARLDVRERAIRRLDDALAAGQLDAAEHEQRTTAVRQAGRNADVAPLLADLGPAPEVALGWVLRTPQAQLATRRLTDADRRQAHAAIEAALRDGRLNLDEFDERSRLVGRARVGSELHPLLADLITAGPDAPVASVASDARASARRPARRRAVLAFVIGLAAVVGLGSWLYGQAGDRPGDQYRQDPAASPTPTRSPRLTAAWEAAADHSEHSEAIGTWFTDTAVIRARVDRIVAYDAANGQQRWIFQPPDGQRVCAMSRDTGRGVGLVGYGSQRPATGCVTVAALDLGTGESLWRHQRVLPEVGHARTRPELPQVGYLDVMPSVDEIAIAADVAVIREADAFVALGLRGDGERWRSAPPAGCWPYSATGAGDDLVLVTDCRQGAWQISRVDTRSGQPQLRAELGRVGEGDTWTLMSRGVVVLSLRPLVVRHPGDGTTTGRGSFVAFDDQGRRRATIPLAQDDGCDLAIADFPGSGSGVRRFANLPYRRLAVVADTLVVPCRKASDFTIADQIAAYSLDDGRRLWRVKPPGEVEAIGFGGGRLFAVNHDMYADEQLTIFVLSADTGRTIDTEPVAAESVTMSSTHRFLPIGDQYLVSSDNTFSTESKERPAVRLRH